MVTVICVEFNQNMKKNKFQRSDVIEFEYRLNYI